VCNSFHSERDLRVVLAQLVVIVVLVATIVVCLLNFPREIRGFEPVCECFVKLHHHSHNLQCFERELVVFVTDATMPMFQCGDCLKL